MSVNRVLVLCSSVWSLTWFVLFVTYATMYNASMEEQRGWAHGVCESGNASVNAETNDLTVDVSMTLLTSGFCLRRITLLPGSPSLGQVSLLASQWWLNATTTTSGNDTTTTISRPVLCYLSLADPNATLTLYEADRHRNDSQTESQHRVWVASLVRSGVGRSVA